MPQRRLVNPGAKFGLLSIPPPYRGWLTISNDPDFTTWERWQQLHRLIWEDLELPFADSFFLTNYNETVADQVNLRDYPEILAAHPHDTMHTWGDFLDSRTHRFTREDAIAGLATLRRMNATPRVWTDHSNFSGNLLHRASRKAMPVFVDSSGHEYPNLEYTADIIREAGVRYVWDGKVTSLVGQDRHVSRCEWYGITSGTRWKSLLRACADYVGGPLWEAVDAREFNYRTMDNRQYARHGFPDGQTFYRFVRFGKWHCADIDSLSSIASRQILNQLVDIGGTCVLYTHLGKPKADRVDDPEHIPLESARVFEDLAGRYRRRDLLLSGTAQLLDYLVLRDHAAVNNGVDFRPDGIRFQTLKPQDLAGMSFGVYSTDGDFEVTCEAEPVQCRKELIEPKVYRISFTEPLPETDR